MPSACHHWVLSVFELLYIVNFTVHPCPGTLVLVSPCLFKMIVWLTCGIHKLLCCHHRYRRTAHVTPKSYLSFINSYKSVYAQQRKEIGGLADRMNRGLEKLVEASQSVLQLSQELVVMEKELAAASISADQVMDGSGL